ncbi:MAG: hypothetical protein ABL921_25970 [Pirellula sp.]
MGLPTVHYQAYIATQGNIPPGPWANGPDTVGFPGSVLGVEGIRTDIHLNGANLGMRLRGRLSTVGDLTWVHTGWFGKPGEGHHIELIAMELTGPDSSVYDIFYTAYFSAGGFTAPAKNGTQIGAIGNRMEAISIWILPKMKSTELPDIKA